MKAKRKKRLTTIKRLLKEKPLTLKARVTALEKLITIEFIVSCIRRECDPWTGELKKAISEMYTARQGMIDILGDIQELKARRQSGLQAYWGKD